MPPAFCCWRVLHSFSTFASRSKTFSTEGLVSTESTRATTQSLWTSGAADFPCYRPPAIAPIPGTATLLAFVEGRFSAPCAPPLGQAELPYEVGGMNLRVSTDHGASWGPTRVIYGNATKQVRLPGPGRPAWPLPGPCLLARWPPEAALRPERRAPRRALPAAS